MLPALFRTHIERLLATNSLPGSTVRIDQTGGALELVLIGQYRNNEVLIRLNELNPDADASKLRDRLQLTQREAEVLLWVSYGKSSYLISNIMSISPRTVNKHLERIFEKLGIETRAAAAAVAIRTITL